MTIRWEFVKALPAVGTAFAVSSHLALNDNPARAQGSAAPLPGHFQLKGKANVLMKARSDLPFGDTRDFEEQKRG